MANPVLQKYVAAGSLLITAERSQFPDGTWASPELCRWRSFRHPTDLAVDLADEFAPVLGHDAHHLPLDLQQLLLRSVTAAPFSRLFEACWVQAEFCVSSNASDHGILRVYVLPDDVERGAVPRTDVKLRKALRKLLAALDFSSALWNGKYEPSSAPLTFTQYTNSYRASAPAKDTENESLLDLFNSVPAPDPHPERVQNYEEQAAIHALLGGTIPGLKTPLYTHQIRSAALMLEREFQPGQVLDPRLVHIKDQCGQSCYYDESTTTVLRAPCLYTGVRGGILAEKMGTGKTLICLAMILATKDFPAIKPDHLSSANAPRQQIGSLTDMAAALITRHSIPWRRYLGDEYTRCAEAIERNPGGYVLPAPPPKRHRRRPVSPPPPQTVLLSSATLVIVPANLLKQWEDEIRKHTEGLKCVSVSGKQDAPQLDELLRSDIVLFSIPRFEKLIGDCLYNHRAGVWELRLPMADVHFKRVIVDEGHKLGNSRISRKSNLLLLLECLHVSARWIVTGTPSTGLFEVDESQPTTPVNESDGMDDAPPDRAPSTNTIDSSALQERKDLERIGSMASLYLQVRPWANTVHDEADTPADWSVYVMQPQHSAKSVGRKDCLRATLNSLIIRHPISEVMDLLPSVDEKIVVLEGSYQDKLCLNLFSMMIISNAVQSQRTDRDYFFHKHQRSSLQLLVSNMRQASFFGGAFFSVEDIEKAVQTAEEFLEKKKVVVSAEDELLLREAIAMGKLAANNHLKMLANTFHEVPLYVRDLPGDDRFAEAWSLDSQPGKLVCTSAPLVHALQKALRPCIDAPHSLQMMLTDGRLVDLGLQQRAIAQEKLDKAAATVAASTDNRKHDRTLAGNTRLGEDIPKKGRTGSMAAPTKLDGPDGPDAAPEIEVAEPLARAQLVSTASAKMSYLIDSILKYQDDEQIIVFYENDNVAFYLAGMLEVLQIRHLIYAKGLTTQRRAQYIDTFNHNPKFRVLLMDITQAAFGLDMRSASRIYFLSPVLNPQVEAQAVGRARRMIGGAGDEAKRVVSVETLVLRGSVEEVVVQRRRSMTAAEQRRSARSIMDDPPIWEWVRNARILPLGGGGVAAPATAPAPEEQMAWLERGQYIFGRGFGRVEHPDEGLVVGGGGGGDGNGAGVKRPRAADHDRDGSEASPGGPPAKKAKKVRVQVRFADGE